MKPPVALYIALALAFGQAGAAEPVPTTVTERVIERGPAWKVIETTRQTTDASGALVETVGRYTVIGNGLHRRDAAGNWVESQPVVKAYSGGIVCTGAAYRVILSPNLVSPDSAAVDLETSAGRRMVSQPLGIALYDPESGRSVWLAQVQDSEAQLVSSNCVVYPDAFEPMNGSRIEASVLYRYEMGRFHQDVTFQHRPAAQPADFGMGERTRLEIVTEVEWPDPGITTHLIRQETNAVIRARMVEPDVVDETLDWGETALTLGHAFGSESSDDVPRGPGIPVTKRLINMGGRRVLVESIDWNDAKGELDRLQIRSASAGGAETMPTTGRELPQLQAAKSKDQFENRLAQVLASPKSEFTLAGLSEGNFATVRNGFTVDYVQVGGDLNNYTFSGGTTYLVPTYANVCGATFEPGTVIKFESGARLDLTCSINFQSGSCPIVFTAKDDNSIGEPLGSGSPSGYYADYAMYCYYFSGPITANNIDVRHATTGLYSYLSDLTVEASSFKNCALGVYAESCEVTLNNVAMANTAIWSDHDDWGWVYEINVYDGSGPNLLPNSSAEASMRRWHGWVQQDYWENPNRPVDWVTTDEAYTGTHAFVMNYGYLYSGMFWAEPGNYVCSFAAKGNGSIGSAYAGVNTWYGGSVRTLNPFYPSQSWTSYSFTFTVSTPNYYKLAFETYNGDGARLYIDAVQIETGSTPTAWGPKEIWELGLSTAQPQSLFFAGDTKEIDLTWWNSTGSQGTKIAHYEVFDELNAEVASGYITNTVSANSSEVTKLALPIVGWQRIVTRLTDIPDSRDELTCTVFTYARKTTARPDAPIGTHAGWNSLSLTNFVGMGFNHTRQFWNWHQIETSSNNFNFSFPTTSKGMDYAHKIYTNIPLNRLWCLGPQQSDSANMTFVPSWALIPTGNTHGEFNVLVFTNFVRAVVDRYKNLTNWYEIINEPEQSQGDWFTNGSNYASVVNATAPLIKAIDPTAKVIALSGSLSTNYANWVWTNLTEEARSNIDFVSCHHYPADNDESSDMNSETTSQRFDPRIPQWMTYFAPLGVPVLNTESGSWSRSSYRTEEMLWNYDTKTNEAAGEYNRAEECVRSAITTERVMKQAARSLGHGMTSFTYYDSRSWGGNMWHAALGDNEVSHSTTSDNFDESFKPHGAALGVMSGFLPRIDAYSRVFNTATTNLEAYLFDTGTTNVMVLFNMDRIIRTLSITNTSFALYDVMGRSLPVSSSLAVNRMPRYIATDALTMDQLSNTVKYASIVTNNDTSAPNISIDIAPTGIWPGGTALLKWSANDNRWWNDVHNKENIVFRYQVDDEGWSGYSQTNFVRRCLAPGNHSLSVQAKDRDGNESSVRTYQFAP